MVSVSSARTRSSNELNRPLAISDCSPVRTQMGGHYRYDHFKKGTRMIDRFFGVLFGKKSSDMSPIEPAEMAMRLVENLAATSKMRAEAQKSYEPYIMLTPAVPIPAQKNAGWFGGAPCLPDDVAWPEIDGEPLRFACQIDLSALPQDLWSGLGPRQGWLSVFFHPENMTPRVLHVDGTLKWRDGPGQADAVWFWPRSYRGRARVQDHSAEWPISITEHLGALPPPKGWRKGKAPGFPDPRDSESPDLANPAFQPINEVTLTVLLESIADHFDAKKRQIDHLLDKKIHDDDKTELSRLKEESGGSMERFAHIREKLSPFTKAFEIKPVNDLVPQCASIPTHDICYLKDDEEGYAVISFSALRLCDKPNAWWSGSYAHSLYQHAVYTYTRNPQALPAEVRERMETIWRFEALHERGAMGHAPIGHVYTPHGPATPNAVLLELPTSDMVGWAWGDMYSIVLFINRDELAHGNFDNVMFEITN